MKLIILIILSIFISGQESIVDHPDPHNNNNEDCSYCHVENNPPTLNNYINNSCNKCHNEISLNKNHIHPFSIKAYNNNNILIPDIFPIFNDSLKCISCHKPFCENEIPNTNILRKKTSQTDLDFCYECHKSSDYIQYNPHHQTDDEGNQISESCLSCHEKKLQQNKPFDLKTHKYSDITLLCTKCHSNKKNHEHIHIGKNISNNLNIKERYNHAILINNISMPLSPNKNIQCNTCHYTHEKNILSTKQAIYDLDSENDYFLRLPKVNICYACHKL